MGSAGFNPVVPAVSCREEGSTPSHSRQLFFLPGGDHSRAAAYWRDLARKNEYGKGVPPFAVPKHGEGPAAVPFQTRRVEQGLAAARPARSLVITPATSGLLAPHESAAACHPAPRCPC